MAVEGVAVGPKRLEPKHTTDVPCIMFVTCGGRFLRSKRCEQQGNTSSIRMPPRAWHDQLKKNIHMSEPPGKNRSSELTQTRRDFDVKLETQ